MSRFLLFACLVLPAAAWADNERIVGGHPANVDAWPDTAAVYLGNDFGCTGVLIAPEIVLTAGHCDWNVSQVVLDTTDYTLSGEVIPVVETISYPNSWSTYDVAILVLEYPSTVEPRMIASDCLVDWYLADDALAAVVGYGAIDEWATTGTTTLMEAFVPIVDADCSEPGQGCNASVSPGGELVAGGGGVDSCNGDSGGPLYLLTEEGDFLIGTTSRGIDGGTVMCGDGGIYVRPDAILDWIEAETGQLLPRPDCSTPVNEPPVPTAEPIEVAPGASATTLIAPNDPDEDNTHSLAVIAFPAHGTVELLGNLEVRYLADDVFEGDDSFSILVTDDGHPPLSAEVEVTVLVILDEDLEGTGGCGCASTGHLSPSFGLLGLIALGWRRRR